jgi:hypothetical protein
VFFIPTSATTHIAAETALNHLVDKMKISLIIRCEITVIVG